MMQSKIKYRYIFLDWSGTLSKSLFWSQLSNPGHVHHEYFDKIINTVFGSDKQLINGWMRGIYSAEEIAKHLEKPVGLNRKAIFNELKISCESMSFVSSRIPELVKAIRNKGVGVGVATDNMDTFPRFTVPAMGLGDIFDDFLVSSSLGLLKTDLRRKKPCFFWEFLKNNRLTFSEILLIDDSSDVHELYKKVGLSVINIKSEQDLVKILTEYAT